MISVCIATHNGEKYIRGQLESILCQLSTTDEVVISDDGSTDETLNIIRSLNDKRVHIYNFKQPVCKYNTSHGYVTKNFENALLHAKGDVIFLADQDDLWKPNKVSIVLEYLKFSSLVVSNYSIIDSRGSMLQERFFLRSPIKSCWLANIYKMPFHGCTMAFKRSLLDIALPFPKSLIIHDNWLGILSLMKFKELSYIEQPLILYRRHDNNVSPAKSSNSVLFKMKYRINFILNLVVRYFFSRN